SDRAGRVKLVNFSDTHSHAAGPSFVCVVPHCPKSGTGDVTTQNPGTTHVGRVDRSTKIIREHVQVSGDTRTSDRVRIELQLRSDYGFVRVSGVRKLQERLPDMINTAGVLLTGEDNRISR